MKTKTIRLGISLHPDYKNVTVREILQSATHSLQFMAGTTVGQANSTYKDWGDFHRAIDAEIFGIVRKFGLFYNSWGLTPIDTDGVNNSLKFNHLFRLEHDFQEYKKPSFTRCGKTIGLRFTLLPGWPEALLDHNMNAILLYAQRQHLLANMKTANDRLAELTTAIGQVNDKINTLTAELGELPEMPETFTDLA